MRLVLDWDGTATVADTMELATVRRPLSSVISWLLETVKLRRGLRELVEAQQPLVLSSNVRELIEPVLARYGIEVELIANELAESGPRGWRVRFRSGEPCPVCGQPCKRAFLPAGPIAYVGDGASDRCAAQAAERVFARGALARYLEERGVAFEPFDDLLDVVSALAPTG
jgi:2-hydroxy-3-keto-5-methylthiopentenyl-1-phosphate phosphatase